MDEKRTNQQILDDMIQYVDKVYTEEEQIQIDLPKHFKELMDEYCANQAHPITPYDFICVMMRSRNILANKYRSLLTWLQYDAHLTPEQNTALAAFASDLNMR